MSILIIGMEMPKSCAGCALYRFGCTMEGECWNVCAASEKDLDNPFDIGLPVWCPLVPVPPHGRLIDADAFLAKMKEDPLFPLVEKYGMSRVIEAQPTIIPAEGKEADE